MPKLGEAFVEITGKKQSLVTALSDAESKVRSSTKKMGARFAALGKQMGALGKKMALGVTAPIVAGFAVATKAFMIQEDAEMALEAALRRTGDASETTMENLKSFASAMQQVTIFGDEAIISQIAFAKNLGVPTDKLKEATKAAIGLAAQFSIDLKTAFMLVGRAAKGQTQMLTRYGIVIDSTLKPMEKFNELLRIGAGSFSLAEEQAKTTSGQVKQAINSMGDAFEQFGALIAPTVIKLASGLQGLAHSFQNLSEITKSWIVTIGMTVAAIGPALLSISLMIKGLTALKAAVMFLNANPLVLGGMAIAALGLKILSDKAESAKAAIASLNAEMGILNKQLLKMSDADAVTSLSSQIIKLQRRYTDITAFMKSNPLAAGWYNAKDEADAVLQAIIKLQKRVTEIQREGIKSSANAEEAKKQAIINTRKAAEQRLAELEQKALLRRQGFTDSERGEFTKLAAERVEINKRANLALVNADDKTAKTILEIYKRELAENKEKQNKILVARYNRRKQESDANKKEEADKKQKAADEIQREKDKIAQLIADEKQKADTIAQIMSAMQSSFLSEDENKSRILKQRSDDYAKTLIANGVSAQSAIAEAEKWRANEEDKLRKKKTNKEKDELKKLQNDRNQVLEKELKNQQQLTNAEIERQRARVGFTGIASLFKKAQVAGAKEQFNTPDSARAGELAAEKQLRKLDEQIRVALKGNIMLERIFNKDGMVFG